MTLSQTKPKHTPIYLVHTPTPYSYIQLNTVRKRAILGQGRECEGLETTSCIRRVRMIEELRHARGRGL